VNAVDQLIVESFKKNPILGVLLGVLMDGGRVVSTGPVASELLSLVPDILFFEQRDPGAISWFEDFSVKDLIFVENQSVDFLWQLARSTGAQVVLLSNAPSDESLVDYRCEEKDLRSALLNLKPTFERLKEFKGQIHFDGSRLNKGLFLDRDGVLIEDLGYVKDPQDVHLLKGVVAGLKKARELDYRLFVVTNQSGIGRGFFNFSTYEKVNQRMLQLLADQGVFIDKVVPAPYFEGSQYASGLVRKSLRKPRPGMIHSVVADFRIDLSQSIMVGDKARDLMAAAVGGISKCYLYKTKTSDEEQKSWRYWPLISRTGMDLALPEIRQLEEVFGDQ